MKFTRCKLIILTLAIMGLSVQNAAYSQDDKNFSEVLNQLSKDAAQSYFKPVINGFGANLNSGWFHKSVEPKIFSFDIEFGIVVMGSFFQDEDKSFSSQGNFNLTREQASKMIPASALVDDPLNIKKNAIIAEILKRSYSVGISGPTVIGSPDETMKFTIPTQKITVDGLGSIDTEAQIFDLGIEGVLDDISAIPFAAPQVNIGTVWGTQVSIRYIPDIDNDEFGSISYSGFGIQHNPEVWLGDVLPIDIAFGFFTQSLDFEFSGQEGNAAISATATAYGITASKRLGKGPFALTPYAGFLLESSEMEFSWDFTIDESTAPIKESFTSEGANKNRFTFGLSGQLLMLNFNVDYSISEFNTVSAGLWLGF